MSHILIPKNKWEVFSTTYATPVECPRCGHRIYVHLSEYGNAYKKYYPSSNYDNFVTDHCDMCGEQLIVEMVETNETQKIDLDTWYDVIPNYNVVSDEYSDVVKVFIQSIGNNKDCGSVVIHREDGWNQIIVSVSPIDVCMRTVLTYFEIKGVSENQDIPVKAEEPLRISEIISGTLYKIVTRDYRNIHKDWHFAEIAPYNPVLMGDDNFTEQWYQLIIYKEDLSAEPGCIIHCGPIEECTNYLYDKFFVFKE